MTYLALGRKGKELKRDLSQVNRGQGFFRSEPVALEELGGRGSARNAHVQTLENEILGRIGDEVPRGAVGRM
jgi:hypothetical protein